VDAQFVIHKLKIADNAKLVYFYNKRNVYNAMMDISTTLRPNNAQIVNLVNMQIKTAIAYNAL